MNTLCKVKLAFTVGSLHLLLWKTQQSHFQDNVKNIQRYYHSAFFFYLSQSRRKIGISIWKKIRWCTSISTHRSEADDDRLPRRKRQNQLLFELPQTSFANIIRISMDSGEWRLQDGSRWNALRVCFILATACLRLILSSNCFARVCFHWFVFRCVKCNICSTNFFLFWK